MTNPGQLIRYNTRNGGRGSWSGANAWAQMAAPGVMWENNPVRADSTPGLAVVVGPTNSGAPLQIIAETPSGFKIGLEMLGTAVLWVGQPLSNPRISAVVAYTKDISLTTSTTNVTGAPESCGLIIVHGTEAASPSEPTDAQIRSAITSDGGVGATAAYAILGTIIVSPDTSAITSGLIVPRIGVGRIPNADFPMRDGFTLVDNFSTRIGKIVNLGLVIRSSQDLPSTQVTVCDLPSRLHALPGANGFCAVSSDRYSAGTSIGVGYCYVGSSILVSTTTTSRSFAKILLSYATQ